MDLIEVATVIPLHYCWSEPLWEKGPSDLSESFYYVLSWGRALEDRRASRGGTEVDLGNSLSSWGVRYVLQMKTSVLFRTTEDS